jgi:diguanylate cyclase (GGDEF)-like protein
MKAKILSVDDNPANLIGVRRLLAKVDGVEIVEARTGNEALAATLDHDFALILLDVHMPDMSGFEVAAFLAQEERTRETPIVFVTATHADELHEARGYRSGAVDYITKPLDERILLSKVQVYLELHRVRTELRQVREALAACAHQCEKEAEERRRSEAHAMHLACHDGLTGLANRRLFTERGAAVLARLEAAHTAAVVLVDLVRLRDVNARHGLGAADRVLVVIARRLAATIADDALLARIGSDEFGILLPDIDTAALDGTILRIRRALESPIDVGSGLDGVALCARIGVAVAADPEASFEQMLVRARQYMDDNA